MTELAALLAGIEIGRVRKNTRGSLSFAYNDEWREAPNAYPLSLSMPLTAREHGSPARGEPSAIEAFLWGLLPDNELVLERWARRFQVSARNVFALIGHVGADCAGAAQFVPENRVAAIRSGEHDRVDWIDEHEIARRLRLLREDHAAWRLPEDTGQFSLAGAQPKTALLFENDRWGIPSGRTPTTHILKPPTGEFDGHAENEHICLAIARAVGLPAAHSRVMHFDEEVAVVIERYDRLRQGNEIIRVHQEDVCQALGIMPTRKYQNEGGPGVADIVQLLWTHSSERGLDVDTFVKAVGFNWLIAGTDAHAKNYSLLIADGPRVRLAPLYDLASIMPYGRFDLRRAKLAVKIGGEYGLSDIGVRQWAKLALSLRMKEEKVINDLRAMAAQIPDAASDARNRARKEGLEHNIIDRLTECLADRAGRCGKELMRTRNV